MPPPVNRSKGCGSAADFAFMEVATVGAGVLLVKKSNIDPYYRASLLPAFKLQKWASSIVRYAIKSNDPLVLLFVNRV